MKRLLGCTMVRYDCQRPIYLCGVPRRCLVSAQEEECRGRAIVFRDLYTLRFYAFSTPTGLGLYDAVRNDDVRFEHA